MVSQLTQRLLTRKALLIAAAIGALAYLLMPSCLAFVPDEDDTLCHAIDAAEGGEVDWPAYDREWLGNEKSHVFDHVWKSPWWFSEEARTYIEGFGLAQGHGWGELGRGDVQAFDEDRGEVITPLGRTYNAYANIVYANTEGIELDRGKSLRDYAYYDTFLKWASAYVYQNTYRVDGNCARNCENVTSRRCEIARTVEGTLRNDFIRFYQSFFYDIDSVVRGSTVFHETRHARGGMMHTAGNGCARGSSCELQWSRGGANTYEMLWLAAYLWTSPDHVFISDARRERAKDQFNMLRGFAFVDDVDWSLPHFYGINHMPEFYVEEAACSEDPENPHRCLSLAN